MTDKFDWRERLEEFNRDLGDDWNSYGAPAWDPRDSEEATRYIEAVGIDPTFVAPIAGGAVGIEWFFGKWEVSIDISIEGVPDKGACGWLVVEKNGPGVKDWLFSEGKTMPAKYVRALVLEAMSEANIEEDYANGY